MRADTRLSATRSNLLRSRRRLDQVRHGTLLVRRKRQSLVAELFARARTAVTSREVIDQHAQAAWQSLWTALAAEGRTGLAPLGWPRREIDVDLAAVDLWGLKVARLAARPTLVRSLAARGVLPARDGGAAEEAGARFEALVERLIEAAPEEHAMRRLGVALARTTRLVNTLEQRVTLGLERDIAAIDRTLGEREREEHLRVKRLVARRRRSDRVRT